MRGTHVLKEHVVHKAGAGVGRIGGTGDGTVACTGYVVLLLSAGRGTVMLSRYFGM